MQYSTCLLSTVVLDQLLWQLWLVGVPADDTVRFCMARVALRPATQPHPTEETVYNFVTTQYADFEALENSLYDPRALYTQTVYEFPAEIADYLITTYYSFVDNVVRVLLAKKFTSKARREMDEVHRITEYPLIGCRRIFENIKRVIKEVEDCESSIVKAIENSFLLPNELAHQYANIVFISHHKLTTEGTVLEHLDLSSLLEIATVLMGCFSASNEPCLIIYKDGIVTELQTLKDLLYSNKQRIELFRVAVQNKLASLGIRLVDKTAQPQFRALIRAILSIGTGVIHSKEFRDILVSIRDRVNPAILAMGITVRNLPVFFTALKEQFDPVALGIAGTTTSGANNTASTRPITTDNTGQVASDVVEDIGTRYANAFKKLVNAVQFASCKIADAKIHSASVSDTTIGTSNMMVSPSTSTVAHTQQNRQHNPAHSVNSVTTSIA